MQLRTRCIRKAVVKDTRAAAEAALERDASDALAASELRERFALNTRHAVI